MSKILQYMPELEGDEQLHVARLMTDMTEEQAERFSHVYRSRRKDPTITLVTSLIGFAGFAGVHRFMLGQVGMGLLYLFTAGFCFIGTIVDAFNYKELSYGFNKEQADEIADLILAALPGPRKELPE